MKKLLLYAGLLLCTGAAAVAGVAIASDKGPAEITLQSTIDPATTPKPAQFPHAAHQGRMECKVCHHSKGPDGKRVDYVAGQKIEKCESCHNSKAGMPEKVSTFKNAAHALCQDCHKKTNADLGKCGTCHKK